jgi:hypothetical protein
MKLGLLLVFDKLRVSLLRRDCTLGMMYKAGKVGGTVMSLLQTSDIALYATRNSEGGCALVEAL